MPDGIKREFGYAIYLAQSGDRHQNAKPMRGFGSASVMEVVESVQGDTYRAVYSLKTADAVYVLHCFQKKSIRGVATPMPDINLIRSRLKAVEAQWKGI